MVPSRAPIYPELALISNGPSKGISSFPSVSSRGSQDGSKHGPNIPQVGSKREVRSIKNQDESLILILVLGWARQGHGLGLGKGKGWD